MGHELIEGLGQGGEDLLDIVAVQRGLDGGAGLFTGAGVGGVNGAGVLQGQGDAVSLEDPVGDVDGVERLGEADVGGALVDGLAQLERAGADVEGGAHMGPELWEGLHAVRTVMVSSSRSTSVRTPVEKASSKIPFWRMSKSSGSVGWGWGSTPNSLVKVSRAWGVSAMEGSLRCAGGST